MALLWALRGLHFSSQHNVFLLKKKQMLQLTLEQREYERK
jgi:hypothetical protein